jgi:hypothetical protein
MMMRQPSTSKVRVTLPADGVYLVSVRDHLNRGGDTFSYRIEATAVEPALTLSLLENRPQLPWCQK